MFKKISTNLLAIIGLLCCLLVFLLNIVYVSRIGDTISETVSTNLYGIFNMLITLFLVIGIVTASKKIDKIKICKELKIVIFVIILLIYSFAQIYWINIRQATPAADQKTSYEIAVNMYKGNWEKIKNSEYLERYPHQITLSVAFCAIFKVFSSTNVKILQYGNVLSNVMTIVGMMLICKNLEKQYKVNKSRTLILIGTFFSLLLLSTFVYGDLMSLPICLFSVYFIMKYCMENKKRYAIISSVFMAMAYILRMNNLIFIIAIVIYLILNIFKESEDNKNKVRSIILKIAILLVFIIISILPGTVIKNVIQERLNLDKNRSIPTSTFIYMGMEEGYRANGWYNDYGAWAWEDIDSADEKYQIAIVERLKYFANNPGYCVKFYIKKIASMWTENTYASLWYNQTFNFQKIEGVEVNNSMALQTDELVKNKTERLLIYQKAIVIIIFGASILVIIKNRKNLSNEIVLLLTIFIGGFLFHILWEAKSRYIIPYVLILIPIASISIDSWEAEFTKIKNIIKIGKNRE